MLSTLSDLRIPRKHISLHFDGLMLSNELAAELKTETGKRAAEALESAVRAKTRFKVRLVEKKATQRA